MANEMLHAEATVEPDWDAMEPEEFANTVEARLTEAGKLLTLDQMDLIEKHWRDSTRDRRCSLIMLTDEYPSLRQKVIEDREFAEVTATVLEASRHQVEFLKGLVELMEVVNTRAMMSLAHREDMIELLDKVRSEEEES